MSDDLVKVIRENGKNGWCGMCEDAADEIERLRKALEEIRDHWANQYDHPRKQTEMYRGSYGIDVTDGHRACTIIAEKALRSLTEVLPDDAETLQK